MEVLISFVTGIILIEAYVWLDPLSIWLVRRVAKELPKHRQAEFIEQFTADLATLPNSIAKVYFAFRDCTLVANSIKEAVYRETALSLVDQFAIYYDRMIGLNQNFAEAEVALQKNLGPSVKFITTVNRCLETLQCGPRHDELEVQAAVNHLQDLSLPLIDKVSTIKAGFEKEQARIANVLHRLDEPMSKGLRVSQDIRRRMLNETPLDDDDAELLDAFLAIANEISSVQAVYGRSSNDLSNIPAFPKDYQIKAAAIIEAARAAMKLATRKKDA